MTDTNTDNSEELNTLRKHNAELNKDLKALKAQISELSKAKDEAETEAATKDGDIEAVKKSLETKYQKQINDLTTQNTQLSTDLKTIRVDNEINSTIASLGIKPEFIPAVEALLHRKVAYEDNQATIEGKGITDWAKEWSAKEGAIYRPAPNNSGAGAMGNDGSKASALPIPRKASEITRAHMELAKNDPAAYNAIIQASGLGDDFLA
jgi:hypothetical protein